MSTADPQCYVRLERAIPGVDHLKAVDRHELAEAHHLIDTVAKQLGIDTINDFYVYSGEYGSDKEHWHIAADGLKIVRAVKQYVQAHESLRVAPNYRLLVLKVLGSLEDVLDQADARDIRFCFVGNY